MQLRVWLCLLSGFGLGCGLLSAGADPGRVTLVNTPDGGIQPQAVIDARGVVHLIYFKGDPAGGDIYYVRLAPGQERFSSPIRVNSQPGSAVATGTIRGAQIAIGRAGRVHVAWNGSGRALPKGPKNPAQPPDSPYSGIPMLYTRLNDAGTAFEPQHNLMQSTWGLDGGGSVAADAAGNVYVAWHGQEGRGQGKDERDRRLYVARSKDDGKSFSREASVYAKPTGACGCCGVRAFADSNGKVYVLYRSATEKVHRDMYLLVSHDRGASFQGSLIHSWTVPG